ncbi:hypothetical protein Gotur_022548 [Gossypium turneri]
MPYTDPDIIECVSLKFLVIQSMQDMKVLLIVYATVEMHESDRVIRQCEWRQKISSPPQDMEALYKLDLVASKSYLLLMEARSRQLHQKRP